MINSLKQEGALRNLFYCEPRRFSPEFCEEVKKIASKIKPEDGAVQDNKIENVRRSVIKMLPKHGSVFDDLGRFVVDVNKFFNLDISLLEALQYTEYDSSYAGHYDLHSDVVWNGSHGHMYDRKLSVTIQLSNKEDYEGGLFCLALPDGMLVFEEAKEIGTVIAFPSHLPHKVNPVTKGNRKSLVSWAIGPQWR